VKSSDAHGTRYSLHGLGCFAAVLLGIAVLFQPNLAAADGKNRGAAIFPVHGNAVDRNLPEVAPGGTLVLRGTRPDNPNPAQPNPGEGAQGGGAEASGPSDWVYSSRGWDERFDYSGLDWAPPGPVIGVLGAGR